MPDQAYKQESGFTRMSVYTQLSEQDFRSFLALYDEGDLVSRKGIEAGV